MKHGNLLSLRLALILLSVVFFLLDIAFPRGVAAGVPYAGVVLLALWTGKRRTIFLTAGIVSVLTVIGFFHPLPEEPILLFFERPLTWISIENRFVALFAIWTTAILAALLIRRDEAIRRERDFSENLVETASSVIMLLDVDGRILHYNRFTSEVTGYELAETKGRDWLTIFAPEDLQERGRRLFDECLSGSAGRDTLFPIRTKREQHRQFSWASQVMTDRNGQANALLFVGQDVTPLIEAQEKVVQSERLAAIGQTLATLSHEARNELAALGLTLRVLDKKASDDSVRELVNRLRDIEGRLTRLFEDVRGHAAPIRLERSTASLADIWRKAWASLERRHGGMAELVEQADAADLSCSIDALRIEQVFRNLFENSLAACPSPVLVTVCCSEVSVKDAGYLRVTVRDNGPGLPPEVAKRAFEPFFTTKSAGTGLGMPIAKRIIEAHGGDLRVGNQTGRAEFVILLPQAKASEIHPALRSESIPP